MTCGSVDLVNPPVLNDCVSGSTVGQLYVATHAQGACRRLQLECLVVVAARVGGNENLCQPLQTPNPKPTHIINCCLPVYIINAPKHISIVPAGCAIHRHRTKTTQAAHTQHCEATLSKVTPHSTRHNDACNLHTDKKATHSGLLLGLEAWAETARHAAFCAAPLNFTPPTEEMPAVYGCVTRQQIEQATGSAGLLRGCCYTVQSFGQ